MSTYNSSIHLVYIRFHTIKNFVLLFGVFMQNHYNQFACPQLNNVNQISTTSPVGRVAYSNGVRQKDHVTTNRRNQRAQGARDVIIQNKDQQNGENYKGRKKEVHIEATKKLTKPTNNRNHNKYKACKSTWHLKESMTTQ